MLELGAEDIRRLIPTPDAIAAVRLAYERIARGEVDQPTRVGLSDGRGLVMLAGVRGHPGIAVKVLTIIPENPARGLPTIHATVLWMGDETGQLSAILDGRTVTALRTGAASGVGTDLLARPDARALAMLGAGAQAPDTVASILAVRPIDDVRVWSRTRASAERLVERLGPAHPGVAFRIADRVSDAVRGADVVATATRSSEPIVHAEDLGDDVHINAIGAYRQDLSEVAPDVFRRAAVVAIDELAATMEEAGDVLDAIAAGALDQSRLVPIGALTADPTWRRPGGISVFKSVGIAAQDWAIAELAYRQAIARPGVPG
jgi:ornithine cyclodeaminase